MPYRHSGVGMCALCNCFTHGSRCVRCGQLLCPTHAPLDKMRCKDCEAEFTQVVKLLRSVPMSVPVLRVLLVVLVCGLLVLVGQLDAFRKVGSYLSVAGGGMTLVFLSALVHIGHSRRSLRARFLAERHHALRKLVSRRPLKIGPPNARC